MTEETLINEIQEAPPAEEPTTDQSNGSDETVRTELETLPPNGAAKRVRNERRGQPQRATKPRRTAPAIFQRFVVISWSGRREPVEDMYWAEATREGDWIVVTDFEQIRSRKDILARLQELPPALVALNFPLSYPADFFEGLKGEGITGWRSLVKRVREDLKKNADDGIRHWIERIGAYRESRLEDEIPLRDRGGDRYNDRRSQLPREPLAPYERGSLAERFRRTDHALRRVADRHLVSPVQIGYNRLTNRYEFTDTQSQGRGALLGMSMLDQLLDTREDAAVWPMMAPKPLTIVEVLPWVFTEGERLQPEALRTQMASLEDRGWDIPSHAIDQAARNTEAQNALRCLLGIIKTESREERQRRPIRDYQPAFYDDAQVKLEGWFYSVGYRSNAEQSKDGSEREAGSATSEPLERNQNGNAGSKDISSLTEAAVPSDAAQE